MTSIWDISLETANRMYFWASLAAIGLGAITVLSAVLTFWASGVISKHNDQAINSARATAEQSRESANRLEAETEGLKNKNLQLAIRLEEERTARLKLEDKLAPRRLSSDQHRALVQYLQRLQPFDIAVGSISGDVEAMGFAEQLRSAIKEAGFKVFDGIDQPVFSGRAYGVIVDISDSNIEAQGADTVRALAAAGIKSEFRLNMLPTHRSIQIIIATKP
ncbi:hypothetical protein BOMU111920_16925 [Bordetella muralis]